MVRRRQNEVPLVFLPVITKTRVSLLEGDFNFHKSNSTYFTDLDSSRSILLSVLCFKGMHKTHKELTAEGKKGIMTVMLGSTYTHFKREIPTGQPYEVWSRILTWDQKWLYIVSHFVQKDKIVPKASVKDIVEERKNEKEFPMQSKKSRGSTLPLPIGDVESAIFATSISKCVFKKERMTVSPEQVFQASGLLSLVSSDPTPIDLTDSEGKVNEESADILEVKKSTNADSSMLAADIEAGRLKGLKFAELLTGLEELQGNLLKDEEISEGIISLGSFSELGHSNPH